MEKKNPLDFEEANNKRYSRILNKSKLMEKRNNKSWILASLRYYCTIQESRMQLGMSLVAAARCFNLELWYIVEVAIY